MLGVPVAWVKRQRTQEWHHTSSRYNVTDYYDLESLQEILESPEGQEQLAEVKAEIAAAKKSEPRTITGATVRWLEWGGTRNHPRAIERREAGCTVVDAGGKFVTVLLPSGGSFRKGKRTNGFRVFSEGKEIFF